MQEDRIRRQLERAKTLGSGAAKEAATLGLGSAPRMLQSNLLVPTEPVSPAHSWLPGSGPSSMASSIVSMAGPSLSSSLETTRPAPTPGLGVSADDFDDDFMNSDVDIELSASQIQQFETENASILRNMQDTLAAVQLAESRLLDISALQMELIQHLTHQTEVTEQLYEDAIATTATVEAGKFGDLNLVRHSYWYIIVINNVIARDSTTDGLVQSLRCAHAMTKSQVAHFRR